MDTSRTEKSIYSISTGIALQCITLIFGFINRTVFIKVLGIEYLGVNNLFTNILSILSLAELGVGTAITYFMYKPLAEKDEEKLKEIMKLYKIAYRIIGIAILTIGLCLVPFLSKLVKFDKVIDINITVIYILFLINTVTSYLFFAYRSTIISADQKNYIINLIDLIFVVISSIVEITLIIVYKNFILALSVKIGISIIKNVVISIKAGKIYPFLNEKNNKKVSKELIKEVSGKVYSIFVFKLSYQLFSSTDNMIISAFVGTVYVGFNANYLLITSAVVKILNIIRNSFVSAVGNINSIESDETKYVMFKRLDFFNFWMNSFCAVCFFQLLNPFITLWLGKEFLFSQATVGLIVINFLISAFLNIVFMYRETMGLFEYGKYTQLIGGICNIILSILLAKNFGVFGVFLATAISALLITVFPFPKIVYKYGFKKSSKEYVFRYFMYFGLTIFSCAVVYCSSLIFRELNYITFIGQMILCLVIPNIIYILIFRKTDEYLYLKNKAKSILVKSKSKLLVKNNA